MDLDTLDQKMPLTVALKEPHPNDFPFLHLVDLPAVLGNPLTAVSVLAPPERAHRYDLSGPKGWNQAVLDILATL